MPERVRGKLMLGILGRIDHAEHKLAQFATDDSRAVPAHHHDRMFPERARERGALLRLHHQQVGVAKLVAAIPEWRALPHCGAEVEHRLKRHAGNRERHDRGRMMMAHGIDVRPRLENLAMDHALRIGTHGRRNDRVGIKIVFEDVLRLHQRGRARAREEIAVRIVRIAHADMAEGIEHALIGDEPVSGSRDRGEGLRVNWTRRRFLVVTASCGAV